MRLTCACRNTLGRLVDGLRLVQHRGRGTAAQDLLAVTCEACGQHHVLGALHPVPPSASAPVLVRCACGNAVGEREGDVWTFRHRGRIWLMRGVVIISCEDCGHSQPGDAPTPDTAPVAVA